MTNSPCKLAEKSRTKEMSRRVHPGGPPTIRLLPFSTADGPHHMAADEVMLEAAVAGVASLRFYAWQPPTISLGYFQKHEERLRDPKLAARPFVRRATGGGAIVHDGDLTYAIALPAALRKGRTPAEWHCRIHHALANLLLRRAILVEVVGGDRLPQAQLDYSCFAIAQPGDVVLSGQKVIGGAQRLRAGSILQHGSIQLPRALELQSDLGGELPESLGLRGTEATWSGEEQERIRQLADERYAQDAWNLKR